MTQSSPLTVEIQNHIAWVSLNRPEKRNAMSFEMLKKLIENIHAFEND